MRTGLLSKNAVLSLIICALAGLSFVMMSFQPVKGVGEPILDVTPIVNDMRVTLTGTCMPGWPGTWIDHVHFDWGDRTTEDGWMPLSHTYAERGSYQVIVTAFQTNGMSTTRSLIVTVPPGYNATIDLIYRISPFIAVLAVILVVIVAIRRRPPRPIPPIVGPGYIPPERSREKIAIKKTIDKELDRIVGYLAPVSGRDVGRPPYAIKRLDVKIGRDVYGKDEVTLNDLQLNEEDLTQSRDQARLRVDSQTEIVYIMHDSDASRTFVDGARVPFRKERILRDGSEIEFGTEGARWRFSMASPSKRKTVD